MNRPASRSVSKALLMALTLSASAASLAQQREINQASLSLVGPSVVTMGKPVVLTMQGANPSAALSVALNRPQLGEAQFAAVADAKGVLRYEFVATTAGPHEVRVLDIKGRQVAKALVIAN